MSMRKECRPLPKFGEWDVNNPASASGFTVIFEKARDERRAGGACSDNGRSHRKYDGPYISKDSDKKYSSKRKWFCWG